MTARRYIFIGRRPNDSKQTRNPVPQAPCPPRSVLLLLLVAAWFPASARAAEPPPENDRDAPVVIGRREKTQWFHLDPALFTLDILVQYQHDRISQSGSKEEASTLSIEETVTAATTGYIVHPNLVELDLSGTFGLAQRFFDNSTGGAVAGVSPGSQSENDILYAWDARATILRNQIAPFTIYTQRSQQDVS